MKNLILLCLIIVTGCQTTTIKNREYKVSPANVELGSIGIAKSLYNLDNDFSAKSFPVLENKIRLSAEIQPLDKSINDIYVSKTANKEELKIAYVDSIAVKPEFVIFSIMDFSGFTSEMNALYNKNIVTYLQNTKNAVVVTSVAVRLPESDLSRIKQADAYYLDNSQKTKYTILLYKQGKKIDVLDLQPGIVLAYTLGKFCWVVNDYDQWYIGDIVKENKGCKGKMRSQPKERKQTSLFKM